MRLSDQCNLASATKLHFRSQRAKTVHDLRIFLTEKKRLRYQDQHPLVNWLMNYAATLVVDERE